jgi:hypothetical protein
MAKSEKSESTKVYPSLDPNTHRILEDLIRVGIFGQTKSEIAASIIRTWIWENEEKLKRHGVEVASVRK